MRHGIPYPPFFREYRFSFGFGVDAGRRNRRGIYQQWCRGAAADVRARRNLAKARHRPSFPSLCQSYCRINSSSCGILKLPTTWKNISVCGLPMDGGTTTRARHGTLTPLVLAHDGDFPFGDGISMDARRVYGSFETGFDPPGVGETIDDLRSGRSRTPFIPLIFLPRSGSSSKRALRGKPCWSGECDDDAPELPAPGPDRLVRTRCVRFE